MSKVKWLYRSMKQDPNGFPVVEESARGLGVRYNKDVQDIPVLNGQVKPAMGGMSVTPHTPYNLSSYRRPPEFGGTGSAPVWQIKPDCLSNFNLQYRPDPNNSDTHGFIEPKEEMSFLEYQQALAATINMWKLSKVTKGDKR
jgi:hypothetical protein